MNSKCSKFIIVSLAVTMICSQIAYATQPELPPVNVLTNITVPNTEEPGGDGTPTDSEEEEKYTTTTPPDGETPPDDEQDGDNGTPPPTDDEQDGDNGTPPPPPTEDGDVPPPPTNDEQGGDNGTPPPTLITEGKGEDEDTPPSSTEEEGDTPPPAEESEDIFNPSKGDKIMELPNVDYVPAGYEFLGWNSDEDATEGFMQCKVPEKNMVVFAIWKDLANEPVTPDLNPEEETPESEETPEGDDSQEGLTEQEQVGMLQEVIENEELV